ncbi:hypothetical protein N658DRAFT_556086 [Parathielavia hyrcaniae]|uniref:SET domain-containing protein n=1 Tax=Parathielavia hyrcaniae TaxID=113614 RepID=A0AAN6QED6_9PEZI|nr:hypothetical protein N658DRAFT_556086 [Parathielavia hyrcaniae]
MLPSTDAKRDLVVDPASSPDKHAADRQHTPAPKHYCLSQPKSAHPFKVNDGDEKQSISHNVQHTAALNYTNSENLDTPQDSVTLNDNNKNNCDIDQAVLSESGDGFCSLARTQEPLASAGAKGTGDILDSFPPPAGDLYRQEAGPAREDDQDTENELANEIRKPIPAGVNDGDGAETPRPVKDKDDCPHTPPPSPAIPAQDSKTTFEEFFKIQPSKLGGLGAFTVRELKKGEVILVERPLLRTTHFRLMLDYANLSDAKKKAYLSLHGAEDGDRFSRVERIQKFNAFAVLGGIAIFEIASRFNHACPPVQNVEYALDHDEGVIELTVCKDVVPAGTEIRISYGGSPIDLYRTYGFRCCCGGCTPLTDDDIRRFKNHQYGIWEW